jgi:hypothetical protein
VNEPVSRVKVPDVKSCDAWPFMDAELENVPCVAFTLRVPALPPPAAADTETEAPSERTTFPVRESKVTEPASAYRTMSLKAFEEPATDRFPPTRTSPPVARRVSWPLGNRISVFAVIVAPCMVRLAPSEIGAGAGALPAPRSNTIAWPAVME